MIRRIRRTSIDTATTIQSPDPDFAVDPAHLAAAAFLARYSGRTLDAYRHDLRGYFNWAASVGLVVLEATRPHIELYRSWLESQGLAASTIDRRLSTVCGFYRFAHIDGRVASNPAQYVRRPQVHPSEVADWTVPNSVGSSSRRSATTTATPRWRSCSA
jgi:integrase/recombinase XerD